MARKLVLAADAYSRRSSELLGSAIRYDIEGRHSQLAPDASDLAVPLLATVEAAEGLEELADARSALAAAEERDRLAAARAARERELQAVAARAAEQLERDVQPGGPIDAMRREDVEAWRQRIAEAQRAFQAPLAGRGLEMHPISHRAWVATNDAVLDVDRDLTDLQERLRTGDLQRTGETRRDIENKLGRLSAAIAWLREIKLADPPTA